MFFDFSKKVEDYFLIKFLLTPIVLIGFFVAPTPAEAGILSFVSGFFENNEKEEGEKMMNSQNIALLQATVSPEPSSEKDKGEVVIVGGNALLPEVGPSGSIIDIEERAPSSDQISVYVVRKGDSLSEIAKMFDVSTNTIVWANDIKGGLLKEGQVLVILPISGVKYTVKSGDTLKKIADKHKGDIDEIMRYNDLPENAKLAIGDVVIIPDGEVMETPAVRGTSSQNIAKNNTGSNYDDYFIKPLQGGRRTQGLHGHNGIDFGAPTGTPIFAAASGQILISRETGWNGGYGGYIVIKHNNGTQTLYAHNSKNIVSSGEFVAKGQVIGYVGSTGRSTGPHLHFEVRGAKNPFR